jgi:hypothetical protein
MLSVGKCGYDNKYGEYSRKYHDEKDVINLEGFKNYITVNGGEHCGQLYWTCVCVPASIDIAADMNEYFYALIDLFSNERFTDNYKKYSLLYSKVFSKFGLENDIRSFEKFYLKNIEFKGQIVQIFKIYLSNYKIYVNNFWTESAVIISSACNEINTVFRNNNYKQMWEEKLNIKYKYENFNVILCNSLENGPQAIDISNDKDVFYISDNSLDIVNFISHEFGIYLLKEILSETLAFKDLSYYKEVESLAEFYNRKICGESICCEWYDKYIEKYKKLYDENPDISAKELFLEIIC